MENIFKSPDLRIKVLIKGISRNLAISSTFSIEMYHYIVHTDSFSTFPLEIYYFIVHNSTKQLVNVLNGIFEFLHLAIKVLIISSSLH